MTALMESSYMQATKPLDGASMVQRRNCPESILAATTASWICPKIGARNSGVSLASS